MKHNFINPFTDFGFKKIFGSEQSKPILLDFLNALLPLKVPIIEVNFENTERLPDSEEERKALFDIYCTSELGEKYIVEMQYVQQANFKERTLYYSTFPIRDQAVKGDWNFELKAVYCISILNFPLKLNSDSTKKRKFIHYIHLKDDSNEVFNDKLNFIYVEMPNFNLATEGLKTRLDQWLYFLKLLERNQMNPQLRTDKMLARAYELAERARLNPEENIYYEARLKAYRDLKNQLEFGKQQAKQAIQQADELAKTLIEQAKKQVQEAEEKKLESEKKRLESERQRLESERQRLESEKKRLEAERKRSEAENKLIQTKDLFVHKLLQKGVSEIEISELTDYSVDQIEYLKLNPPV